MLRTGKEYLESVRDGRRVLCGGEWIDDITTHPKTCGYARQVAAFYDLHLDPEHREQLTFTDENGVRRAKQWKLTRSKEDVVEKRLYYDFIFRNFHAGMFTRLPCSNNTTMYTLFDDPEPWEEQTVFGKGRAMARNIRNAWQELRDGDLFSAPCFIDLQYDRSQDSSDRVPMLRIVDERDDGILVEGWKAIGTSTVFSNWMNLGVLWNYGTRPDQIIYARVPTSQEGITHVARDSYARDDAGEYDYRFSAPGDELDSMAYFDNVLIPWENVYHLGNEEHARLYPQRIFDWIHIETQIRQVVNAELIAGLGLLLTESLGTSKHPVVASQLADMIRFRETCRAFTLAAEETGNVTPGGLYKPNNIFVDLARAYYIENVNKHIETLTDLCGRSIMMQPVEADLNDEHIGPQLANALRGPHISARDKMKIVKVIRDRFYSEAGARHEIFERFNGTPVFLIKLLTMQRVEYAIDGPLVDLARKVCDLGDIEEMVKRASEERQKIVEVRSKPDYIKGQDVETV